MPFKIVRKTDGPNIKKSMLVDDNNCIEYKINEWATASDCLTSQYHPTYFEKLMRALEYLNNFLRNHSIYLCVHPIDVFEIWEIEIDEKLEKLPLKLETTWTDWTAKGFRLRGILSEFDWPKDTCMAKKIKLIKKIDLTIDPERGIISLTNQKFCGE